MNTEEHRPDPDALLAAVQKEEGRKNRGKLKIFLGMAAGVGKTYAMLQAAHECKADGTDVVIGYVETHGRRETEALLAGLQVIPRRQIEYRGTALEEMDLDAVLARPPQLAIVDELAHTNAPGARHPKRYQDVQELLEAGIDVYTTLNVQHLESRADAVRQITGADIRETVPDSIVETADAIELIDITPEELRSRLAEGKVYIAERAEIAAQNFFRMGNLTALREMALRFTAERVDHQLQDYMQLKHIAGPWKSGERLMVSVSPSYLSERLVRWTRRMAYNLDAPWLAVYVEPLQPLSTDEQAQIDRNLALARELGGEVVITASGDVPGSLLRIARQRNATQIVVGKPEHGILQDLLRGGSYVNRLIRVSGDIDIYVVSGDKTDTSPGKWPLRLPMQSGFNQYFSAALVIGAAILLNLLLLPMIGYRSVALVMLFVVSGLSLFVGRGPVLLAAAMSAMLWNLLFIPPRFTFLISSLDDIFLFGTYFVVALVTGTLASRLRAQEQALRRREERTETLYALTREMGNAITLDAIIQTAVRQIGSAFDTDVAIVLSEGMGNLAAQPHPVSTLELSAEQMGIAAWVFANRKPAGRFTDTLPSAAMQYSPLIVPGGIVGVMVLNPCFPERITADQRILLEMLVSQVARGVEREMLDEAAERTAVLAQSEQLSKTLLNSVSHELRTPIATILGAVSSLRDSSAGDSPATRRALSGEIQLAGERLNRLVENLLDMTRLESGRLTPHKEWCDVGDLVHIVIERTKDLLAGKVTIVDVTPGLPLVQMDFVLMEQALANLLDNAATHTPPGTRVRLTAKTDGSDLVLSVADRGPGLPADAFDRVFEKFYRAPDAPTGGVGLGLSITCGLVEAQGGSIRAENRTNGGARFIIRMPLGTPPTVPPEAA